MYLKISEEICFKMLEQQQQRISTQEAQFTRDA